MIPLTYYLVLSALLFMIGAVGVLTRRNAIIVFMCIELMLNAVNITFVAFSYYLNQLSGQIIVFFVITVAAAEAAVGLGIMVALYRNRESLNVDEINLLKKDERLVGGLASALVGASFVVSLLIFLELLGLPPAERLFEKVLYSWIE